jgi:hypothetical protein
MADQSKTETPVGWARVFPALATSRSKSLRHGAWYPVVRDQLPDRVSIRMGSRTVDVPRRLVEVRRYRPTHFSIVDRVTYTKDAARPSVHNLGKLYVVCPACSHRFALFGQPETRQCPACGHVGEVGWWEV